MEFKAATTYLQTLLDKKLYDLNMRFASTRAILEGSAHFTTEDTKFISVITAFLEGNTDGFDHNEPLKYYNQTAKKLMYSDVYAEPSNYTYFWGILWLFRCFILAKEIIEILNAKKIG